MSSSTLDMPKRLDMEQDQSKENIQQIKLVDPTTEPSNLEALEMPVVYKLYKRRWLGILAIVLFNVVSGMNGQFFGPVSLDVSREFQLSLSQVNWLSNIVNLIYLPATFLTSMILKRIGIKRTLLLGGVHLLFSTWIRYAATSKSVPPNGKFAILMVSQTFISFAQPCVQIICVRYSELWFDIRGRVVSTMLTGLANPLGGAIGSLLLPAAPTLNWVILMGGFIAIGVFPFGFLLQDSPPTPPTFAGSKRAAGMRELLKAMLGKVPIDSPSYMELRDRLDFGLLLVVFGILVSATGTWSNFSNQIYGPYGYNKQRVGIFDATLLLCGIVSSIVGAPLIGRMFGRKLPLMIRVFLPIIAACWVAQIWNVKPNNSPAIFVVMAIIGVCSFLLLPIGLELGCEVTRNAEASCALLWFSVNLLSFAYILIEDKLRAGLDANPPENMLQALIFNGSSVAAAATVFVLFFRGKQSRREMDIAKLHEAQEDDEAHPGRHSVQVVIPKE